jgi:hypothetical protein
MENERKSVTVNDPSAGSPTDTVLRLDHSLDNWVYKTSQVNTIASMTRSESFTESSNRLMRRAVCTKGRDVISTS